MKGMKALLKTINDFTKTNFGIKAVWHKDFEAIPSRNRIGINIAVNSDLNSTFLQDCEERFPEVHTSLFIWLLMHEIGHCMTEEFWTEYDSNYFLATKARAAEYFGYFLDENSSEETYESVSYWLNDIYHAMPDEYLATNWAGAYMMNHPKKMAKFNDKFNKALKKFYEKNDVAP